MSGNPLAPTTEIDGRFELQQMSGALPTDEIDTLPSDDSSAATDGPIIQRTSHDDSFRKTREPSKTPLKALEPTDCITQNKHMASLDVHECAHHVAQNSAKSPVLIRNSESLLPHSSSATAIEEPSNCPLPPSLSINVSSARPLLISLPPISLGSSDSEESDQSVASSSELHILYMGNNLRVSTHFPHLKKLLSSSRHENVNIIFSDYTGNVMRGPKHLSHDFMSRNSAHSQSRTRSKLDGCRQFICFIDSCPKTETRLVVVEDLNPSVIN